MGIGWVQTANDIVLHDYSATIQLWPSSYKAELLAILSAICTCPRNSNITIYTDSQSVISKFNKLTQQPPGPNKQYSYNYWPIWHTLLNLVRSYKLTIKLQKITAHSNNTFNDLADSLAKNRNHATNLELLHNNIYNPSYYLQHTTYVFEQPTRKSIKNICNSHIIAIWSSQHRMENIIPLATQIDWNAT